MISYAPLWATMKAKKISSYALVKKHDINNATLTRMRSGGYVSTRTIDDLCNILDCGVQDIIQHEKTP